MPAVCASHTQYKWCTIKIWRVRTHSILNACSAGSPCLRGADAVPANCAHVPTRASSSATAKQIVRAEAKMVVDRIWCKRVSIIWAAWVHGNVFLFIFLRLFRPGSVSLVTVFGVVARNRRRRRRQRRRWWFSISAARTPRRTYKLFIYYCYLLLCVAYLIFNFLSCIITHSTFGDFAPFTKNSQIAYYFCLASVRWPLCARKCHAKRFWFRWNFSRDAPKIRQKLLYYFSTSRLTLSPSSVVSFASPLICCERNTIYFVCANNNNNSNNDDCCNSQCPLHEHIAQIRHSLSLSP